MYYNENVLMITLDCCSYDTYMKARTPFLDSLGVAYNAETYGTYTLPAHMSIFAGYLPKCVDVNCDSLYYKRGGRQLWRLKSARHKRFDLVDILLDGDTIIEGYRNRGFYTLGVGGVRWFKSQLLTSHFDKFLFTSGENYEDVFEQREREQFALNNYKLILEEISDKENWFVFINSHETHVPYNTGERTFTDTELNTLNKARKIWGGKVNNNKQNVLSTEEFKLLKNLQIEAMEVVDKRIRNLVDNIPTPFLMVIMGDHGEEFGEEGLYGHGFPHRAVTEVPLMITYIS